MLRVTLTGNLGGDPESRTTERGDQVVTFRVAVNGRRQVEGEWQDRTDWFRVRCMGRLAERIAKNMSKGDRVAVLGALEVGEYTDREQKQRTSLDVWADEVENLTPKPRTEGSERDSSPNGQRAGSAPASSGGPARASYDEPR
jgi:single-strand DNA-binding protein